MALLFDLDGTLTDPFEGITKCIQHSLTTLGRPSPPRESLRWCIGPPLKSSLARLLASDDDRLAEEAVAAYRERFGVVGLYENDVYPDIPDMLDGLKKMGHTLFVATSKPTVYAERIIDHFGLRPYFSRIYGSELDGTHVDKTTLIAYLLQREVMDSSETLMIGDRRHDIIGAKANNIDGIGVLWGYGTREELEDAGACACIAQPLELVVALRGKTAGTLQPVPDTHACKY
ncbi:MAG: HAD family hydrolase [Deltaproteobacteria bacterium]|nr:HAD family hydrolase [Deltaproteobacteria bacterium]